MSKMVRLGSFAIRIRRLFVVRRQEWHLHKQGRLEEVGGKENNRFHMNNWNEDLDNLGTCIDEPSDDELILDDRD